MHRTRRLYESLVTLPDRLYPFQVEIDGEYVRGVRAYQARLAEVERQYGQGHYGYRLEAYRQLFHLTGSLIFLVAAAYLSRAFFSGSVALDVFLVAAVVFITFQEFYLHRKLYAQLWKKGFLDWFSWCIPIGLYFLFSVS